MFEFGMVKLVILLLTGPFIEFDCSRYWCSSESFFLTQKSKENLRDFQISSSHPQCSTHLSSRDRGLTVHVYIIIRVCSTCVHNYASIQYICTQLYKCVVHLYKIIQMHSTCTCVHNDTHAQYMCMYTIMQVSSTCVHNYTVD